MSDGTGLERFRSYLLLLARVQIGDAAGNLEPSDLVQQTLLEAHQKRDQFRGGTDAELAGWLRRLLACTVADAWRTLHRDKRDVDRRQSLDDSAARVEQWLAVPRDKRVNVYIWRIIADQAAAAELALLIGVLGCLTFYTAAGVVQTLVAGHLFRARKGFWKSCLWYVELCVPAHFLLWCAAMALTIDPTKLRDVWTVLKLLLVGAALTWVGVNGLLRRGWRWPVRWSLYLGLGLVLLATTRSSFHAPPWWVDAVMFAIVLAVLAVSWRRRAVRPA